MKIICKYCSLDDEERNSTVNKMPSIQSNMPEAHASVT